MLNELSRMAIDLLGLHGYPVPRPVGVDERKDGAHAASREVPARRAPAATKRAPARPACAHALEC